MKKEDTALAIWIILFFGFLMGYLFGIFMCKKMPERFGIVPKETECSCCESGVHEDEQCG